MQYREEVRDLFSVSDDYYLAHCISADFGTHVIIVARDVMSDDYLFTFTNREDC